MVVFVEVMFDENISGELPEHIDFIKNKAFPLFESWGYETKILRSGKTYMDCFNQIVENPIRHLQNKGKKKGFPMPGHCNVNRDCKLKAIRNFYKSIEDEVAQYVGIAVDEQTRLSRLGMNEISLLAKYGYTEQMAFDLCKQYDLLSPVYEFSKRGGCWFCPNARNNELMYLRKHHPELWQKLLDLENEQNLVGNIWNTLTKTSIHNKDRQFFWQEHKAEILAEKGEMK